jgi:hypothetical protein
MAAKWIISFKMGSCVSCHSKITIKSTQKNQQVAVEGETQSIPEVAINNNTKKRPRRLTKDSKSKKDTATDSSGCEQNNSPPADINASPSTSTQQHHEEYPLESIIYNNHQDNDEQPTQDQCLLTVQKETETETKLIAAADVPCSVEFNNTSNGGGGDDEDDDNDMIPNEVHIPGLVHDALIQQWKIVYCSCCCHCCCSEERDRERGGLVLYDGNVNPGHFCFDDDDDNAESSLSPLSKIKHPRGGADDGCGGGHVRVGTCSDIHAGWDHTAVIGVDPSTHHHAELVYGHFHIHADNAVDELKRLRLEQQQPKLETERSSSKSTVKTMSDVSAPPPSSPPQLPKTSSSSCYSHYTSTPSCGDVAAWLIYHRNTRRAFVVTRTTSWLLLKFPIHGHTKNGIECPWHIVEPWIQQLERHKYHPIALAATRIKETTTTTTAGTATTTTTNITTETTTSTTMAAGCDRRCGNVRFDFTTLYYQMLQHGFAIYTCPLAITASGTAAATATVSAAIWSSSNHQEFNDNVEQKRPMISSKQSQEHDEDERVYTLWKPAIANDNAKS